MKTVEDIEQVLRVHELKSVSTILQSVLSILSLAEVNLSTTILNLPSITDRENHESVTKGCANYINLIDTIHDQAGSVRFMVGELKDLF